MNKNVAAMIGVGVLAGGLIGYGVASCCKAPMAPAPQNQQAQMSNMYGSHQMPDGSMMSNMPGMGEMMMDMTANLKGKTGATFDRAFLEDMIVHHQGAVDMAKMVLTQSDRPELKALARDIITAQEKEIQMMQQWEGQWFK